MDPPEDWLEAPPVGTLCFNTFLPCKTPLDLGYRVPPDRAWTVQHALHAVRATGRPLAAVVDLSSGRRYYRRERAPWGREVPYYHVTCTTVGGGRDDPPRRDAWHSFWLAVGAARAACPAGIVLVHCTHGFNRTGYEIALAAVHGGLTPGPAQALAHFQECRPPGVYKPQFVAALFATLGVPPPQCVPPWPHWRTSRTSLDALPELWRSVVTQRPLPLTPPPETRPAPESAHEVGEHIRHARRMDEVGSVSVTARVLGRVAAECGCSATEFGGSQPVALDVRHLHRLAGRYLVTWKADGVRVVLYVDVNGTFLVNRRLEVRDLGDALRGMGVEERRAVCPMVLDGELVLAADGRTPVVWVYDALCVGGRSLRSLPMRERLVELVRVFSFMESARSDVRLRRKGWWPVAQAARVWNTLRRGPCDGLILASKEAPYVAGRDMEQYKWKDHITVDFFVTEKDEMLLADEHPPPFGGLLNVEDAWRCNVVEAAWDQERGGWVALHVRRDKPRPNARDTFDATWEAIRQRVGIEEIVAAAGSAVCA